MVRAAKIEAACRLPSLKSGGHGVKKEGAEYSWFTPVPGDWHMLVHFLMAIGVNWFKGFPHWCHTTLNISPFLVTKFEMNYPKGFRRTPAPADLNLSSLSRARVGGSRPPVRRRRRAPTRACFALNATPRTPRAPPTPMAQGPVGLKAPRGRSPAQTQTWLGFACPTDSPDRDSRAGTAGT